MPTVTAILPVVAPIGTTTEIDVVVALVTIAEVVLNLTMLFKAVALKPVPVIVTTEPIAPKAGVKLVIAGKMTKSLVEVAVCPLTVTVILSVDASAGTVTVSDVAVTAVIVATLLLNVTTLFAIVVLKPVPERVTLDPVRPLVGKKLVIVGGTTKSSTDKVVRSCTVTLIFPVVAPAGTVTVRELTVAAVTVAAWELNLTIFSEGVLLKFFPTMVIDTPGKPLEGSILVISGELNMVKSVSEVAVFPSTRTVILPVVAVEGTVTVIVVGVTEVTVEGISLNLTILFDAVGLKLVPVITTVVPTVPFNGAKLAIVGLGFSSFSLHEFIKSKQVERRRVDKLEALTNLVGLLRNFIMNILMV